MGYPGDTNQPGGHSSDPAWGQQPSQGEQPPWDADPLESDPWARHPLSAPPAQPEENTSWHESPTSTWTSDAPWQPDTPVWPEPQVESWANEKPTWSGELSSQQTPWQEAPAQPAASWPDNSDGPSGPQQTPWHDGASGPQQPYTGLSAQQPYDGLSGPQPAYNEPQQPFDGLSGPQQAYPWANEPPPQDPEGPAGPSYPGEPWGLDPGFGHQKAKSSKLPLIIGASVVGAVLVAGGAYAFLGGDGDKTEKPPVAGKSSPAKVESQAPAAQPTKPAAAGGFYTKRTTDPKPLTLDEVFKKAKFTDKGVTYLMTTRKVTTCAPAVKGAKLLAALKQGGCTQFLRATFTTSGGKLIGTIGVANLKSASAAKAAAKVGNAEESAYLVALPKKGITAKIGPGAKALGNAEARGHYLIMSWVQLPNGKPIPAKAVPVAQTFVQSTIFGSNLGPALEIRNETGKPAV